MKDVLLITGASSEFGALTARALAVADHRLRKHARHTRQECGNYRRVCHFQKEHDVDLQTIELDVTSEKSADAATARS